MKKALSLLLVLVMCLSLCACGKSEAVKNVEAMIDALGEITLESIDIIRAAEDAYAALTKEEQTKVSNYKTLTAARDSYYELALVGDWCCNYIISFDDIESEYNRVDLQLNADMTSVGYADGGALEMPGTWSVTDGHLMVDRMEYGYAEYIVVEEDGKLQLQSDVEYANESMMTIADFHVLLDDMFLIIDLAEVDINDCCEPIFYDRYEYNEWGEAEDEVCTTILIKNKLADDGWLYLDSFDDVAIEIFAPEYSVESVEYSRIETTASGCIYDSVYKLYYWLSSKGKPSCDLDISEVSWGRAKGRILFVNKEYVVNMYPDSNGGTRLLDVEVFGETIQVYAGPWLADIQY